MKTQIYSNFKKDKHFELYFENDTTIIMNIIEPIQEPIQELIQDEYMPQEALEHIEMSDEMRKMEFNNKFLNKRNEEMLSEVDRIKYYGTVKKQISMYQEDLEMCTNVEQLKYEKYEHTLSYDGFYVESPYYIVYYKEYYRNIIPTGQIYQYSTMNYLNKNETSQGDLTLYKPRRLDKFAQNLFNFTIRRRILHLKFYQYLPEFKLNIYSQTPIYADEYDRYLCYSIKVILHPIISIKYRLKVASTSHQLPYNILKAVDLERYKKYYMNPNSNTSPYFVVHHNLYNLKCYTANGFNSHECDILFIFNNGRSDKVWNGEICIPFK
jgi:hypothetical protein